MEQVVYKRLSDFAKPGERKAGGNGYDLFAAEKVVIPPSSREVITTDLVIEIPKGFYGQIAPRSGLAAHFSVDVGAGVVDDSYRGSLKVLLINHGKSPFTVEIGQRIAQLLFIAIAQPIWVEGEPSDTARGSGGMGSTGLS